MVILQEDLFDRLVLVVMINARLLLTCRLNVRFIQSTLNLRVTSRLLSHFRGGSWRNDRTLLLL